MLILTIVKKTFKLKYKIINFIFEGGKKNMKNKDFLRKGSVLLILTLIVLSTVPATANLLNLNKKEENEISNEEALVNKNILSYSVEADIGLALTSIKNPFKIKADSSDDGDNRESLPPSIICYGVEIKDFCQSWSFISTTPGAYTYIGDNGYPISGGTWVESASTPFDKWYVCEFSSNSQILTIDDVLGDIQPVGPSGVSFLEDLAFDDTTDILYGCTSTHLYTINKDTGAASPVGGSFGIPNSMVGIAFDISGSGTLYGISYWPDNILYTIDCSSGAVTTTSPSITDTTGNPIDLGHSSDIEYDKANNVLYLAAFHNNDNTSHFYYCVDFPNGIFEHIGAFPYGGFTIISGLAIHYCDGDTTPPVTIHDFSSGPDGLNGWYVTAPTITLHATDIGVGVSKTYYQLDGGGWTQYTGTAIGPISDCEHTLEYYSVDFCGNVENIKSVDFKVDTVPPQILLFWSIPIQTLHIFPLPPHWVCSGILNIGFARDMCSGLDYVDLYVNSVSPPAHSIVFPITPPGSLQFFGWWRPGGPCSDIITAKVYDKAGN